jgi:hypothetical protein
VGLLFAALAFGVLVFALLLHKTVYRRFCLFKASKKQQSGTGEGSVKVKVKASNI